MGGILSVEREIHLVSVSARVRACRTVASPFIISLLLDLCLDLGSDLLQVHGRLGRLTFLLRHTLSTALFQMGKSGAVRRRWHHITTPHVLMGRLPSRCHARGSAGDRKRARRICLAVWSRLPAPQFRRAENFHARLASSSGYDWSRAPGLCQDSCTNV